MAADEWTLFDPAHTVATACPVPGCGAIRFPNQGTVVTCECDRQRAINGWLGKRPSGCLNHYDPEHEQIPF